MPDSTIFGYPTPEEAITHAQLTDMPDTGGINSDHDSRYVNVPGDTMTGALTITPASGDTSLTANKDIVLKAGQKIYFDGA